MTSKTPLQASSPGKYSCSRVSMRPVTPFCSYRTSSIILPFYKNRQGKTSELAAVGPGADGFLHEVVCAAIKHLEKWRAYTSRRWRLFLIGNWIYQIFLKQPSLQTSLDALLFQFPYGDLSRESTNADITALSKCEINANPNNLVVSS
ncbi:hypothetical protein CHS0354_041198 [Potamilus streckersoni]|uniref:Uncharacterized protein n=1 Tax=Potamilus streckersoni TaxID=2493646 RepID=A0AAE0VU27_9BIVA|nr:hypothetical protein CHS0354_041198 [Potamilus streckersoni]